MEATKYLYVGIFADEKGLQFLELLQWAADQCLQELHTVVSESVKGGSNHLLLPSESSLSSAYGQAFQTGLKTVRNWGPQVLQQEAERLKVKCPAVDQLYKYVVIRYLQEIYKYERPQTINVNVPTLREFLRLFYLNLANNPITRQLKYFSTFGLEKKTLMMDCVRTSLFQLLESQIDYETAVRIEHGEPKAPLPTPRQMPMKPPLRPWSTAIAAAPPKMFSPPTPPPPTTPRPLFPFGESPLPSPATRAPPPPMKKPPQQPQQPQTPIPSLSEMVRMRAESVGKKKKPIPPPIIPPPPVTKKPIPSSNSKKVAAPPVVKAKPKAPMPSSAKSKPNEMKVIELDVDLPDRPEDKPEESSPPKEEEQDSPKLFDEAEDASDADRSPIED